ncbi:MAG TPA: hypothetical protein VGK19_00590 [Capsulimonadaceae bacterium]
MKQFYIIALCLLCIGQAANAAPRSKSSKDAITAPQVYAIAMKAWANGNQAGAEAVLAKAVEAFPSDQRLAFFNAACTRSRFDVEAASPLFANVRQLAPASPDGKCALYVMNIDGNVDIERNFRNLGALAESHPTDVMIMWMAAVESRQIALTYKGTDTAKNVGLYGIHCYEKLLSTIKAVGPSLVHQTFANLLDDSGRTDLAVVHRRLAVAQEPASWSCEALVGDLEALGLNDEAARVRTKYARYLNEN